ncbi:MAG: hypothetical protein R3337_08350 [Gammaproteobacteria bacterium]|nr:hypothetical protein [Gammaproteobacteria bacterium]
MEETVRIRDRFQFDLELGYPIPHDETRVEYELEAYLFLPPTLGVNRDNYSKINFYDDLDAHIRLRTPSIPLDAIVRSASGPLSRLSAAVMRLSDNANPKNVDSFIIQVKLFCCVVRKSLRKFVHASNTAQRPDERIRNSERYAVNVSTIRRAYRDLESRLRNAAMFPQAKNTYRFGDEFLSLLFEECAFRMLEGASGVGDTGRSEVEKHLFPIIRAEINYRRSRGFPSIASENSENENLLYRRSVLKRYVGSVLQLDTHTKPGGKFAQETLFGVAAGLSMLFATAVLFVYQAMYGALSLPVFFALIVSYVFKDRIKELLRIYFTRKLSGVLSDHKTRLYGTRDELLGVCEESFDFVGEKKIPPNVLNVRDRDHMTEIEGTWIGETVLRYKRKIRINPQKIGQLYENLEISELDDVLRFNVTDLVKRAGTPEKPVYVLAGDGYRRMVGDRVHHLNLVIRRGGFGDSTYERFRLVLNQKGIKRIDAVTAAAAKAAADVPKVAAV